MCLNSTGTLENILDPDQTQRSVASNLDKHCLRRPICLNTKSTKGAYEMMNIANKSEIMTDHSLSVVSKVDISVVRHVSTKCK